jgi:2-aminoadipate transaminase
MQWTSHFAKRTGLMQRSAVREFIKVTSRPGMISFAGGLPAMEALPADEIRASTDAVLRREGSRALQYGPSEGVPELREWIAKHASKRGSKISVENVAIMNGSQQALDLLGRVLLNEGDVVGVENPTYLSALSAWRPLGVSFRGQRFDENDRLETGLAYVIPNFQNPQGTTLSLSAREHLLRSATNSSIPIIEDNPYGELRYDGEPLPDLFDLGGGVGGPVIYTSTFSKTLAPSLRIGWVIAHHDLIEKLVQAKQAADLQTGAFNQLVALELVRNGFLERNIPRLRELYRPRRDAMLAALKTHMPSSVKWEKPEGGMFIMIRLPPGTDAASLAREALGIGVAIVPGMEFHVDGTGQNTARLNFTYPNVGQITLGIEKLGMLLRKKNQGQEV